MRYSGSDDTVYETSVRPRWLVAVLPPKCLERVALCQTSLIGGRGYHTNFVDGILMPLQHSLVGQLQVICRDYSLPAASGLQVFLCLDGIQPRLTEEAFPLLWTEQSIACAGAIPIAAKLRFEIDEQKARWFTPWMAEVMAPPSRPQGQHQRQLTLRSSPVDGPTRHHKTLPSPKTSPSPTVASNRSTEPLQKSSRGSPYPVAVSSEGTAARPYPYNLSCIFPPVYPYLDLYPALTPGIKLQRGSETKAHWETTCSDACPLAAYPFNLSTIFPPLYPAIEPFPSLVPCILKPAQTPSFPASAALYPFNLDHLYPPIAQLNSSDVALTPVSHVRKPISRPSPLVLQPLTWEDAHSNDLSAADRCSPASPFRLPSASLMDRLAQGEEDEAILPQYPNYDPTTNIDAQHRTLIESNPSVPQRSLRDHMTGSPSWSDSQSDTALHTPSPVPVFDSSEMELRLQEVTAFLAANEKLGHEETLHTFAAASQYEDWQSKSPLASSDPFSDRFSLLSSYKDRQLISEGGDE